MFLLPFLGALALLLRPHPKPWFANDPRRVVTTCPVLGLASATPTLRERFDLAWIRLWQRLAKPQPLASSFTGHPTNRSSIHGLLNQCMDVTGVRYVMPKDVAAGTIAFGHTNTLNGLQWVSAIAEDLQHRQVD